MKAKFAAVMVVLIVSILFFRFLLIKDKAETNSIIDINSTDGNTEEALSPVPTKPVQLKQDFQGDFKINYLIVRDLSAVTLHSNLQDKQNSDGLRKAHSCTSIVSGGFYSKEDTHIGLFITDSIKLSNSQTNATFNGYLSINGRAQIGSTFAENSKHAVQTGPLLIQNSAVKKLSLKNDENARRIAAAVTREGHLVFMVVYDPVSVYLGPKLEDLPSILKDFSDNTSVKIRDAINLDGGTASLFHTQDVSLPELVRVGSFFCIK
jgi:uncharacterized protein YigE (DUF2233 family)